MRPLLTSALAAAIVMAVLPAIPQRADARIGVVRCQMPDGGTAYSSNACSTRGATPSPLSADVLSRIASDQRREEKLVAMQSGVEADALPTYPDDAATIVPLRRPLSRGCATSPEQLVMDLRGSVAMGDVNRIAESFDWAGMNNQQAQRIMARLGQISGRPVRDFEYFDASTGQGAVFADAGDTQATGSAGLMQVTFDAGNGDNVVDFDVRRDKGCFFLRY